MTIERPPKKKPKKRPATIPESARWDRKEGYWIEGPTDDEGRLHGLITSWWSDGALCARIERSAGEPHGECIRYHLNGEVAQTFTMVHGKMHGLRIWHFTDEPTYEVGRPTGLSEQVMRSEMVYDMGDIVEIRHFDGEGQRVTHHGEPMDPKPEGLPEDAWKDPRDGLWKTGRAAPDGKMIGPWTYWDAEGQLRSIGHHAEDESLERFETYHSDGTPAMEVDFLEGRGTFRRGPVPEGYQDLFLPEGADEVRFVPHALDPVRGRLWPLQPRYFTKGGEEVPAPSDPEQGPPADAEAVSRGTFRPTLRWRHAATEGDTTTTTYWREDGTLVLRTKHRGEDLIELEERDEEGGRVIETFHPGTNDGYQRPLHAETVVATESERWVFTYDAEGRCTGVTHDGEPLEEPAFEGVDTEGFAEAFERRFGAAMAVGPVSLWFDFCSVVHLELEAIEEPIGVTTLTADGGGNSAVVVTAGKHAGRVFFHDHEEGPFALEEDEVRDWLEEYHDEADASADARVEAMPFFENVMAESMAEFFRGIVVGSDATYWGKADDFEPLETGD